MSRDQPDEAEESWGGSTPPFLVVLTFVVRIDARRFEPAPGGTPRLVVAFSCPGGA